MSTPFNQAQHLALLAELAMAAGRVVELARMIQDRAGDEVAADVLAASVEVTAQRMGWLCTVAQQGHHGEAVTGVAVDTWLMPPLVKAEAHDAMKGVCHG